MFYNFQLSSVLAKYFGVDLGSYMGHNKYRLGTSLWMRWVSLMMGVVFSPYADMQVLLWEVGWRGYTGFTPITRSGGTISG